MRKMLTAEGKNDHTSQKKKKRVAAPRSCEKICIRFLYRFRFRLWFGVWTSAMLAALTSPLEKWYVQPDRYITDHVGTIVIF